MNVLETFKQFLLDNGCLESYIHYLKIFDYTSKNEYNSAYRFILDAFCWERTKEGIFFWASKDGEWRTIIKNYDENIRYNFTQVLEYLNTEIESLWTN